MKDYYGFCRNHNNLKTYWFEVPHFFCFEASIKATWLP